MYGLFAQTKNGIEWLNVQDSKEYCTLSIEDYPLPKFEAFMVIKLEHFEMREYVAPIEN